MLILTFNSNISICTQESPTLTCIHDDIILGLGIFYVLVIIIQMTHIFVYDNYLYADMNVRVVFIVG